LRFIHYRLLGIDRSGFLISPHERKIEHAGGARRLCRGQSQSPVVAVGGARRVQNEESGTIGLIGLCYP